MSRVVITSRTCVVVESLYGYCQGAMCGRYTLAADLKKVADRLGAPMPTEWADEKAPETLLTLLNQYPPEQM